MSRSILIVVNPTAGHGKGRRTAGKLAARLRTQQCNVTVRETREGGDAEAITRQAIERDNPRPDCIVACGGDGTVQEVAGGLASCNSLVGPTVPPMGLAPAGRCNDFARALGLSTAPERIATVLRYGTPRAVDLGWVNRRYFCTVATIGVDAEVSRYVDAMRVPLTGTLAYLYGALRVLSSYQPQTLRIAGDFGVIERPVLLASSANTASYGGAIPIAPDAVPTDGLLDLCLIDPVSRLRALALTASVLFGRHRAWPEVHFLQTKRLTIEADRPQTLWADGERVAATPATITVVPRAVRVLVPPDFDATGAGPAQTRGSFIKSV